MDYVPHAVYYDEERKALVAEFRVGDQLQLAVLQKAGEINGNYTEDCMRDAAKRYMESLVKRPHSEKEITVFS